MYYILCDNKYCIHIAFVAYLLKLDCTVVTDSANLVIDITDDQEYSGYYDRLLEDLYRETRIYLTKEFLQYYILGKSNFQSPPSLGTVDIDLTNASTSLILVETEFYTQIVDKNIISNAIVYTNELLPSSTFMEWIFVSYFERSITADELAFWHMNCVAHKINIATAILICIFSQEGQGLLLHQPFFDEIKICKYNIPGVPNIAVIYHGYSRYFLERFISHERFILSNPYIDVFIHTWTDRGHKYEFQLEKINPIDIQSLYNPKGFSSEDIWPKLKGEFSLVGKLNPIFLENSQDKGDATQYINAKLYSIQRAFELLKDYEMANGFTYDGIIKLGFDIDITDLDMKQIAEDITTGNIYFKDGCDACDNEVYFPKNHDDHTNPLDLLWYYGNRTVIEDALNLYDNAQTIAESFQAANMANISNVQHRQRLDFVYVYGKDVWPNIGTRIICYTPHRLMREQLKNIKCKTSRAIGAEIIKPAAFENNL